MTTFLNLVATEPEIARVPVMVDSSKWSVHRGGPASASRARPIVNSISLKEGEEKFLRAGARSRALRRRPWSSWPSTRPGQADTAERKVEICERAYRLLVEQVGFPPEDIIFDPNIFAVATGIEEHNGYAIDFIEATRRIKERCPGAKISGGVSNLSLLVPRQRGGARGDALRVPLPRHPRRAWTWASSTPASSRCTSRSTRSCCEAVEDVLFNRRPDATERLVDLAERFKGSGAARGSPTSLARRAGGGAPRARPGQRHRRLHRGRHRGGAPAYPSARWP